MSDEEIRRFPLVNLVEIAEAGIPEPVRLFNDLLYRGALHSLAGPPDCGKSTVAYQAALDLLGAGLPVVILDEEGGREVVTEKLLALGAKPAGLGGIAYCEFPTRRWDEADRAGLWKLLEVVRPAMVLVDSAGAFLAVAGQNENWAEHTIPFYKLMLQAARDHDAAVIVVDHVKKDDANGRYARGSGAKLAIVDVAFMVDAIRPFSRLQDGLLKFKVTKDRRGFLHRQWEIRVSVEDGLALAFERVQDEQGDPALAGMAPATIKVLTVLRTAGIELSNQQIGDRVKAQFGHGLKRTTISKACLELLERGATRVARTGALQEKYWEGVEES
jgi:hypothetical protein